MPIIANVEGKIACTKLAMIYTKPEDDMAREKGPVSKGAHLQRQISQSLMHEQRLLNKMNMIAVIPIPWSNAVYYITSSKIKKTHN